MKPEFNSDNDAFLLILKNLNYGNELIHDDKEENVDKNQNNLEVTTQKATQKTSDVIVMLLQKSPELTRKEISELIGITEDGVKYHLKKLKEKGSIERIGPDKGGIWKVNI